jgi:group I intron endonuclease
MKTNKVYLITNLINNKKYVGITTQTLKTRWWQHKHISSCCSALHTAISEYGTDNFNIKLLKICSSEEEMIESEMDYIDQFNTICPNGYNVHSGGQHVSHSNITKDKAKERMFKRWHENPNKEQIISGIKKYVDDKKTKIIGINIKDSNIIRYASQYEARKNGYHVASILSGKSKYSNDYTWFYDEGLSDEEYKKMAVERLGCGFGEYSRGKDSWKHCDRERRVKSLIEGSKPNMHPILGVSIESGKIIKYESVRAAKRDGFALSSIMYSINRKSIKGQGHVWFTDDNKPDSFYIDETLKLIGSFKTLFTIQLKAINLNTLEEKTFVNIYKASDYTNIKIKEISRHLKRDKGFGKRIKNWYFEITS